MTLDADVAILGSGFAGSLAALILRRHGLRPLVVDRTAHPRFAIGESSTPIGNYVLREIAERHGFDWLLPLAKYGTWQRTYPQLVGGLKRGFSYFCHPTNGKFAPRDDHGNELLVAASSTDEHGDTHWRRADVDGFIASQLHVAGIPFFEKTRVVSLESPSALDDATTEPAPWRLVLDDGQTTREVTARFLLDATGEASVLPRSLQLRSTVDGLQTRSRALFTHLDGIGSWTKWLEHRGGRVADHPFNSDDAAQHHLVDGAWMWVLRFNQGTTSIGLAIDMDRHPVDERISAPAEWSYWMARYPSIAQMVGDARLSSVPGRWIRSERIQRRFERAVGPNWALLPHTAGFIDPLHSSGIAHSLCGVERLTAALLEHWQTPSFPTVLRGYEAAVLGEIDLIDRLVAGCYASLREFRVFAAWSMLYFAAATTYERRRAAGGRDAVGWFLCADDERFTQIIRRLELARAETLASSPATPDALERFEDLVARELAPYNHVGLFDRASRNMYRHTAAPE